jgi:hypothetical protein
LSEVVEDFPFDFGFGEAFGGAERDNSTLGGLNKAGNAAKQVINRVGRPGVLLVMGRTGEGREERVISRPAEMLGSVPFSEGVDSDLSDLLGLRAFAVVFH